jgi:hypothetical protein
MIVWRLLGGRWGSRRLGDGGEVGAYLAGVRGSEVGVEG